MVKVMESNYFALGHLVLTKKGAWAKKFIYCAIRVEGKTHTRILSIRRRA